MTGAVHANANSTNDTTIALNFRTPTIAAGTETPAAYSTWASGSWVCFTVALTVAFTKRVVLSGSTWAVPADWSTINRIVAIGAGGNGAAQAGGGNSGGGGGAFCQIGNVTSTNIQPLDSLSIQIATAGQQVVTWLKNRAGTPAIILQADYGRVGVVNPGVTPAAGGVGGAIANNIPASTGFAGAAGGTFNASGNASSAGGGGSAGPLGVGKSSTNLGGSSAGSGGGGSNGGSSTVGLTGSGGNLGGQGSSGTGAGAASGGAATAGKGGGGGGGALGGAGNGGLGAVNTSFDGTTGPGGGGGGGGEGSTTGGSGGTYGGGGGGAGTTGGTGGQGLIVAMYQPAFNTVGATIQQTPAQLPEISSLRTWLSTTAGWLPPAVVVTDTPRNQYSWTVSYPDNYPIDLRTWTAALATAPRTSVKYIPGSVYDWGTIADVREPRTWIAINPALLTPIVATPRNQYDWVLPKVAEQPVRTWISFQQPGLIPKVPVKQTDWPLPKVAEQPIRFWSQAPQITPPVVVDTTLPCVVVDWGLEFITPFTAADTQRNTALLAPRLLLRRSCRGWCSIGEYRQSRSAT